MNQVAAFAGIEITEKRKTFTALLCIPVLIAMMMVTVACPKVNQVVSEINTILTEVGPAIQIVTSLLPLLTGKQVPPRIVAEMNLWSKKAQGDITALQAIIEQFKADLANPTAQAKINTMIQTTEQDVSQVLTMINVLDSATQQKITEMVTAIGAAIVSVENIIASVYPSGTRKFKASPNGQFFKDGQHFKTSFNSILHLSVNDPVVDSATSRLNLN